MAGTWDYSITVTLHLRISQIAGCKKENPLITTHVQGSALNEPGRTLGIAELLGVCYLLRGCETLGALL